MIGQVLRIRYEVTQLLQEGPVFSLYQARDRVLGKDVFLRVLQPPFSSEPAFIEALRRVASKSSNVQHSGVERLVELDEDEGVFFLVSEASTGTTLAERIKKLAPFSVPVSVGTAIGICEALSGIHSSFMVHGDVGTSNVMVTPEGDVRLQLAVVWESFSSSSTVGAVVLPGLAPYLAPEISRGGMPSPASDIYSVGVILFELLAGRKPYIADYPVAMAMLHASEPTPEVRDFNPSVPVALNEIIKKAMAKEPSARYKSAGDMLSDLRMVRDALRFGKSLAWPLQGGTVASEPQPVAPTAAAAAKEAKPERDRWVEDVDDEPQDIPGWLKMTMVVFGSFVVFIVGAWILFNLSKPKEVLVPALQRLSIEEARSSLGKLNLKLSVEQRVPNEEIPADQIVDSTPGPGSKVYEGQTIGVRVSQGSKFVEVPDLRGFTVDKAKAILDTIGLVLDDEIKEVRDRDVDPGIIVSHTPEAHRKVERNSRISVTISIGNRRTEERTPSDRKYIYTVSIRLTDIDEDVTLRVDMTDSKGTRTVHESVQGPGAPVEITAEGYGEEVTFRIFYDGELVKQVTKRAGEDGQEVPEP